MESVWAIFLSLMRDYDVLDMTEEEAFERFQDVLLVALPTVQLKGLMEDVGIEEVKDEDGNISLQLSRRLTTTENLILGYSSVVSWLAPYIYSSELLLAQLTSTDYTQFSSNMRLQTYIKLNNEAEARLNQAILDYDTRTEFNILREGMKRGKRKK